MAEINDLVSSECGDDISVERWLEIRRQEALRIDPETAEVTCWYALTLDPYGVYGELSEEGAQVGREYFARSPKSDIWVWFGDLPEHVQDKLQPKRAEASRAQWELILSCVREIKASRNLSGSR